VDKIIFPNRIKTGTNREFIHCRIDSIRPLGAFQADDEGSIPFTPSNHFKHLAVGLHV
jgi:hypothetical protein